MINFAKFAQNPYDEKLFCEFVRYAQGKDASKLYKELTSIDKGRANVLLAKRNIFDAYSYAANFVLECLEEAGCQAEIDWPVLNAERPERIHINIGKDIYLTVCLYRFDSGRVELIGYVS